MKIAIPQKMKIDWPYSAHANKHLIHTHTYVLLGITFCCYYISNFTQEVGTKDVNINLFVIGSIERFLFEYLKLGFLVIRVAEPFK